jgi:hypothetical protein
MSGRIETANEAAVSGPLQIECARIDGPVRLTFGDGEIRLMQAEFRGLVTLIGTPRRGESESNVKIRLLNCSPNPDLKDIELDSGFWNGLNVSRAPDVLVRANWMTGGPYDFEDCRTLTFDGNTLVSADYVRFRQTNPGGFKNTRVMKCDFHGVEVRLEAPKCETPDKVVVDKCWFGGLERPEEILQQAVRDGARDEACGVRALFRKINKRPLGIGGTPAH